MQDKTPRVQKDKANNIIRSSSYLIIYIRPKTFTARNQLVITYYSGDAMHHNLMIAA